MLSSENVMNPLPSPIVFSGLRPKIARFPHMERADSVSQNMNDLDPESL